MLDLIATAIPLRPKTQSDYQNMTPFVGLIHL
jgi:hypothetical protein